MPIHPAFAPGRTAVITGAASGIGLAAAERMADIGMRICLADLNAEALAAAARQITDRARQPADVISVPTDVSRREDVERLKARAYDAFGEVTLLMNNAGRSGEGGLLAPLKGWTEILDTNLWGVIHGVQVFAPAMIEAGGFGAIVNTGSKQGITCPPGNTAYNVSKAGVKVVTEALAHELRSVEGCRITAHLLIPGFTFTGITAGQRKEKPAAAWTSGQVVDFMMTRMAEGDFYILCPDNEVTRDVDEKRIRWAADDIVKNRPALSRWHADFKEPFAAYMRE
jgi:NAD(P)-dependent dehydrogenase (short-subunit alcohol dehydrogenase family)